MIQRPERPVPSQRINPEARREATLSDPFSNDDQGNQGDPPHATSIMTMPRILIACATLIVLLVVGGGAAFLLTSSPPDRSSPTAAVNGYYTALSHQDYTRAWQYVTDSRNNVGAQSADINGYRSDDATLGKVISVSISGAPTITGSQAVVSVSVTRAQVNGSGGTSESNFAVTVTQFDGNTWLIAYITSA